MIQQTPVPFPPQQPFPDLPPDVWMGPQFTPDDVAKIVFFGVAGLVLITWIIARGPIGHAIGEVIKRWLGGQGAQELPAEIDAVMRRLDTVQQQLSEVAERQEFTERLLAQVRREKALPGASDVQR